MEGHWQSFRVQRCPQTASCLPGARALGKSCAPAVHCTRGANASGGCAALLSVKNDLHMIHDDREGGEGDDEREAFLNEDAQSSHSQPHGFNYSAVITPPVNEFQVDFGYSSRVEEPF